MANDSAPKKKDEGAFELETQFIMRLPEGPAEELRKALRAGSTNVKDRLSIQMLDNTEFRRSYIRFDNWIYNARLVDLPCIIESLKTIDKKTFSKTADISQMLVCVEEDESQQVQEEESKKKKDPNKPDKKYLWPHGITPSLKNVRKRRLRKTLKKKYVDAPEIEKEVRRLLRVDNEAVSVKWEIITEDDDKKTMNIDDVHGAESLLFGEVVSSSDDEVNILDSGDDETSRLSGSMMVEEGGGSRSEFATSMLERDMRQDEEENILGLKSDDPLEDEDSEDQLQAALHNAGIIKDEELKVDDTDVLLERIEDLRQQLVDVQARRQAQELEIASIENIALKQRLQSVLETLLEEEADKQRQYNQLTSFFEQ